MHAAKHNSRVQIAVSQEQPLAAVSLRLLLQPAAQEQCEAECIAVSLRHESRATPLVVGFLNTQPKPLAQA